jgi:hypothetical protein
MAATKIVAGILREIWQEGLPGQAGGPFQVFTTGIRIDPGSLSRVRALLVVDSVVGGVIAPIVIADAPNGFLRFAVSFSGNPAVVVTWTLDAQLTHSIQQARDPNAGAYIAVVNGSGVGGILGNQSLAQTYDFGAVAADQHMIIDTARGGGVWCDASTAAVTAADVAFEVRANATWATPTKLSRRGDDALSHILEFEKARNTYAVPFPVAANDAIGTIDFTAFYNAAFRPAGRIQSVCLVADASYACALDFYVANSVDPALARLWRMDGSSVGSSALTCYGANPYILPGAVATGYLGSQAAYWSRLYVGAAELWRASTDIFASTAAFYKSRGTPAIPADIAAGDNLGLFEFYGRSGGAYTLDAVILAICESAAPAYGSGFEFHLKPRSGALSVAARLHGNGIGANTTLLLYNNPDVLPAVDSTGRLGEDGLKWAQFRVNTGYIYQNLLIGTTVVGGGAVGTLILTNAATMPVPQANQVYVGSVDFSGDLGTALAVLAVSAEEPVQPIGAFNADTLIPIVYNGHPYYILAMDNVFV